MEMNRITDEELAKQIEHKRAYIAKYASVEGARVAAEQNLSALLELQSRRRNDAIVAELLLGALKGLLALNEKQFRMLEETARRGLSTMTPAGVKFDDLKFVKLSKAAIQKAEEAGL